MRIIPLFKMIIMPFIVFILVQPFTRAVEIDFNRQIRPIDAVYQPAPRAQHRLEHKWIAELFARFERSFCTKADARARCGNARTGERSTCGGFVCADCADRVRVDCGDSPSIQLLGGIQSATGAQAAHENRVVVAPCPRLVNIELNLAVKQAVILCAGLVQCCKNPFLFHAQAGVEHCQAYI